MGSDTYGKKSVPTRPMQTRVQIPEPAPPSARWEGDPTHQRCPLCLGEGHVPPDLAIAFEAYCAKLRGEQ